MFACKTLQQAVTQAREMVQEATSLLVEAVLGAPVQARAGCPSWPFCGFAYGTCGSCGAEKRKRLWKFCWDPWYCYEWVDCVYC